MAAKKSTAKKGTAKKSAAKKSTVKKSTVKKSALKKNAPKKSTAKKSPPKKIKVSVNIAAPVNTEPADDGGKGGAPLPGSTVAAVDTGTKQA